MCESRVGTLGLWNSFRRAFSNVEALKNIPNNAVTPSLYNRNPRNLERLRIATKPTGYALDNKPVNYWHRLVILQSNRHIHAYVEHYSGNKVISASTKEWAIKKCLKSTVDSGAAKLVGTVLAQRCLESGMLEIHSNYDMKSASQKILLLLKSIEDGGISLTEPERFIPHRHWSRELKEKPTDVYE